MKSCSTNSIAPMIDRRRFILGLGLLAACPTGWAQPKGMTAVPGATPAPALRLRDADNQVIDLAQYQGRVILVNFWATWCPPCRAEFPSLGRVRKLFASSEFEVLAVNVGEEPDTVFTFTGITEFPLLFDREAASMAAWSVRGLPTSFLVDRQGRLAYRATGGREFDDAEIVATIKQLLAS